MAAIDIASLSSEERLQLLCERQRAGLGDEFLAAVQSAMGDVVAHPTRYPGIHRDTRRALVRRFPHGIFYRLYGEVVVVVACMHGRRDPRQIAICPRFYPQGPFTYRGFLYVIPELTASTASSPRNSSSS